MHARPPRLPPPDDWGEEPEEEPDAEWPDAPGDDAEWSDPGLDEPDPEGPWDPDPGPCSHEPSWPGDDEEPLPGEDFEIEVRPLVDQRGLWASAG